MHLTIKQQVKHLSKEDYKIIKHLSHIAKNLSNEAIYNYRQHFFKTGTQLRYESNYKLLKDSPNYKILNSNMSQQILKEVDDMFGSYFGLCKLANEGKYDRCKIKLPHYLPKDGFTTLIIGFVRINGNKLTLPYSRQFKKQHKEITITIPPIALNKHIKEIRIKPKANARFFEIHYIHEVEEKQRNLDKNNALAIDLGIDNLATCVTTDGESFIVDGRRLKSINQWFNKQNAMLQSIKDNQKYGESPTNRQKENARNRNNRVNDYMAKTARIIINYCLEHNIGTLVCGYNNDFQKGSKMGKVNNQTFVNIPFGNLKHKLKYLCKLYGLTFVMQEESYTSKASFFDNDFIPTYEPNDNNEYSFSGKRVKRGLYKAKNGMVFNADVNGALNILRKSSVVPLDRLYSRGELDTPIRIKVA